MKRPRPPSIRTWLLGLAVACTLPLLLAICLLFYLSYHHARSIQLESNIALARALSLSVDRELASDHGALSVLALSHSLRTGDMHGFDNEIHDLLIQMPTAYGIVLADPSGQTQQSASRMLDPSAGSCDPALLRHTAATAVAGTSDLYNAGTGKKPLICIATPAKRDGRTAHVLAMTIQPEQLRQALKAQRLPEGSVAAILDRQGRLIARTLDMDRYIGHSGAPALLDRMHIVPEDAIELDSLEGRRLIVGFSRSAFSGWTVAIGTPVQTLTAPYLHAVQDALIVSPILLAALLAAVLYSSHRIAASVRSLVPPAIALSKGFDVKVVPLGLKEADEVAQALRRTSAKLNDATHRANHDFLTGLPNRAHFCAFVTEQLAIAVRHERPLTLLYIDLDGFKRVNDLHGHAVGNALLRAVAERLRDLMRNADFVARLGGDELALALPDTGPCGGAQVASKIISALSMPFMLQDATVAISASIGIAAFPQCADNTTALMQHADEAMYAAKQQGKASYAFARSLAEKI